MGANSGQSSRCWAKCMLLCWWIRSILITPVGVCGKCLSQASSKIISMWWSLSYLILTKPFEPRCLASPSENFAYFLNMNTSIQLLLSRYSASVLVYLEPVHLRRWWAILKRPRLSRNLWQLMRGNFKPCRIVLMCPVPIEVRIMLRHILPDFIWLVDLNVLVW